MVKSRVLTERLKKVLSQGQGGGAVGGSAGGSVSGGGGSVGGGVTSLGTPSSVGDGIRGGSGTLGPSYAAAPGKGQSSPSAPAGTSPEENRPLSISGAGWMNYFASPIHPRRRKRERGTL
jgi:hypothetical protein